MYLLMGLSDYTPNLIAVNYRTTLTSSCTYVCMHVHMHTLCVRHTYSTRVSAYLHFLHNLFAK